MVSHGPAHLSPSQRYYLKAGGIERGCRGTCFDMPSNFVRAYVTRPAKCLTLLVRRMDAVAAVYVLCATMFSGIDGFCSRSGDMGRTSSCLLGAIARFTRNVLTRQMLNVPIRALVA